MHIIAKGIYIYFINPGISHEHVPLGFAYHASS